MGLEVTGGAEMLNRLLHAGDRLRDQLERALFQEALIETRESMQRTPIDTGALRASHETHPAERDARGNISVTITVGGPAGGGDTPTISLGKSGKILKDTTPGVGYALYVHENLDADHPVGQAKFLESTLLESAPHIPERVARRISLRSVVS